MSDYYTKWAKLQALERHVRPSSRYLVMLVALSALLGGLVRDLWLSEQLPAQQHSHRELESLHAQLVVKNKEIASQQIELQLAQQAQLDTKAMFAEQHLQHLSLERELAFYRSIMAPENIAEGVAIHGLELSEGVSHGTHQLKLILTQLKKRKRFLKGKVNITLIGVADGGMAEVDITSLTDDKFDFSFRYFQVFESSFTLPAEFNLVKVRVQVKVPKTRWSKAAEAEQVFNVSELLEVKKEQPVLLEQNSQVIDNSEQ